MRFRFDANQEFQLQAVEAITDLFQGQGRITAGMTFTLGQSGSLAAVPNRLDLNEIALLGNLRVVQNRNRIGLNDQLRFIEETIQTPDGPATRGQLRWATPRTFARSAKKRVRAGQAVSSPAAGSSRERCPGCAHAAAYSSATTQERRQLLRTAATLRCTALVPPLLKAHTKTGYKIISKLVYFPLSGGHNSIPWLKMHRQGTRGVERGAGNITWAFFATNGFVFSGRRCWQCPWRRCVPRPERSQEGCGDFGSSFKC